MNKIKFSLTLFAGFLVSCGRGAPIQGELTTAEVGPIKQLVCDPFSDGGGTQPQLGIKGSLYYLTDDQPRYHTVGDYISHGHQFNDLNVILNNFYVPPRIFSDGFVTREGQLLMREDQTPLFEYFALHFETNLALSPRDVPGNYQLAMFADDGAILNLADGVGGASRNLINNDGDHATKLKCATSPVTMGFGTRYPLKIDYYQGPRYHLTLIVMWRPWPANPADVNDPLCGVEGINTFYDTTQNPSVPQQTFRDFQARGWKVLAVDNYIYKDGSNPCVQ